MKSKEDFSRENVDTYLDKLTPETDPRWGGMTAQHMVEHLEDVVSISGNKASIQINTPEDKIERYKEKGLMTPYNWPINTRAPESLIPGGELQPLRHKNLTEARSALSRAIRDYDAYFAENHGARTNNAVFGALSYDEWQQFHFKHFRHHFQQFGLIDRPYEEGMRK
jgi:oxepin-CoA hydrolase/3-oxo-5,6-dehydrosuberyl-CoA semialdehyde dehydrogenase